MTDTELAPEAPDLDAQAREAVKDRAVAFFNTKLENARVRLGQETKSLDEASRKQREEELEANVDEARDEAIGAAMAVYEDAIARRGPHQAALDQLQGAVGLPEDPRLRQAEVERRTPVEPPPPAAPAVDNMEDRLLGIRPSEAQTEDIKPAGDVKPTDEVGGLTDEQLRERDRIAAGGDPS